MIFFYSESGCGKTFTALHVARGIAGPAGKIKLVDTESGRGSIYADVVPGGYDVAELDPPFTPERYIATIEAAEKEKTDVLVIDSMSHEWEGEGGILDQATEREEKSGKTGLHNWRIPKLSHQKLITKLLRCRLKAVICCIRAKYKSRQTKPDPGKKSEIIKDDYVTPIQSEEFIFEATVHAEILPNHCIRLTKGGHPDLEKAFPLDRPLGVDTGKLIAQWCDAATVGRAQTQAPAATATSPDVRDLKKRLIARLGPHFSFPADTKDTAAVTESLKKITEELRTKGQLPPGQDLGQLNAEELGKLVEWVENNYDVKF